MRYALILLVLTLAACSSPAPVPTATPQKLESGCMAPVHSEAGFALICGQTTVDEINQTFGMHKLEGTPDERGRILIYRGTDGKLITEKNGEVIARIIPPAGVEVPEGEASHYAKPVRVVIGKSGASSVRPAVYLAGSNSCSATLRVEFFGSGGWAYWPAFDRSVPADCGKLTKVAVEKLRAKLPEYGLFETVMKNGLEELAKSAH